MIVAASLAQLMTKHSSDKTRIPEVKCGGSNLKEIHNNELFTEKCLTDESEEISL